MSVVSDPSQIVYTGILSCLSVGKICSGSYHLLESPSVIRMKNGRTSHCICLILPNAKSKASPIAVPTKFSVGGKSPIERDEIFVIVAIVSDEYAVRKTGSQEKNKVLHWY